MKYVIPEGVASGVIGDLKMLKKLERTVGCLGDGWRWGVKAFECHSLTLRVQAECEVVWIKFSSHNSDASKPLLKLGCYPSLHFLTAPLPLHPTTPFTDHILHSQPLSISNA